MNSIVKSGIKQLTSQQIQDLESLARAALNDFNSHTRKIQELVSDRFYSENKTSYLNFFSREKDRCFKQYLSAMQALNQAGAKPMQINIKTQSAYLAQNQQNNLEINDPQ